VTGVQTLPSSLLIIVVDAAAVVVVVIQLKPLFTCVLTYQPKDQLKRNHEQNKETETRINFII
jgi:hypothetical protein